MSISATVLALALTVYREAGATNGHTEMVKVADVVINRVHSEHFPHTVDGVLYQQGQFNGNHRGRSLESIKKQLIHRKEGSGAHPVWDDALKISQAAVQPGYRTHHGYTFFHAAGKHNHFYGNYKSFSKEKVHYHGHRK